ncbi:MAG TPA: putative metal-binding motif-containing protein, partial [Geobacteraceae bacterium]
MRNAIATVFTAASILLFVAGCGGGGTDHTAPTAWYKDADGDGYSDGSFQISLIQPVGHYLADALTGISGDCDDGDPGIHPEAAEACDTIDNDCDGAADDGVTTPYYPDADGDGYGAAGTATQACSAPQGYVADSTDCDDTVAAVHPGAAEIPGDDIDENCDALESCYADL